MKYTNKTRSVFPHHDDSKTDLNLTNSYEECQTTNSPLASPGLPGIHLDIGHRRQYIALLHAYTLYVLSLEFFPTTVRMSAAFFQYNNGISYSPPSTLDIRQ